jgi:predicted DNA-binding protein
MARKYPRFTVSLYPYCKDAIGRLMVKTDKKQADIVKEALERGLRQMEYELEQIEKLAQRGY